MWFLFKSSQFKIWPQVFKDVLLVLPQPESLPSYQTEYLVMLMGFTVTVFNSGMCHFLLLFQMGVDWIEMFPSHIVG